jgi:DNA-binding CsgD family transcriptional regulator
MAVMVVRDLEEGRRPVDSVLGGLFGMTPSEVRVAVGIVQGDTPQEIAVRLGLSVETVRSHLKRVFYKSSTRNQADLVRLVLGQCVSS